MMLTLLPIRSPLCKFSASPCFSLLGERKEMHLWPSMRIRDSFKISYLKKLEWNLQRMNSEKKRQSQSNDQQQTLLVDDNQINDASGQNLETPSSKNCPFGSVCREILLVVSCCYCCFCCGVCIDQEEN